MRRWAALALLAAVVAVSSWPADAPAPGGPRGLPQADGIWLATYNLNFERPSAETAARVAAIEADVLVLQESTAAWEELLASALGDRWPHRRFWRHEAEGGQAILSRFALEAVALSAAPEGGFPAHCATVAAPWGPLRLLHLHLHPPLSEDGSLLLGFFTTGHQRLAELRAHEGCGGGGQEVVLGDLNEGEGVTLDALTADGFVEAQRVWGPVQDTWTWETPLGTLTGRPDHVLVSAALEVTAVEVLTGGASDHRPLRAQVRPR